MKVLIVNALFHPFPGGVEKHAVELATELVKQGVEVHVLTGRIDGTKAEETYRGIRIHRIDCTELRIPRYYPPPLIVAVTSPLGRNPFTSKAASRSCW